jgi:flavin-dependent dehydrogenase
MTVTDETWDALIIGGGPASATAAYYLARAGTRVAMIEREEFPRYAVGESLLPQNMEIFRDMGFDSTLEREGFMQKHGAVFANADGPTVGRISFADGLRPELSYAYQVPRDRFDNLLLKHARDAGAELMRTTVLDLIFEDGRAVGLQVKDGNGGSRSLRSRLVIDASGRAAFIGRKLGLMEYDTALDTASVFGLFSGVDAPAEAKPGDITILAYDVGWFWFIPFADGRTSVGTVVDRAVYEEHPERSAEAIFDGLVERAGGRVPRLMTRARRIGDLHSLRRFNRRASRFAGPGWVLVGDAAMFVDPVFSAGVLVAMTEARMVAGIVAPLLKAGVPIGPEHFDEYGRTIESAYGILTPYIYNWRDPAFRRIFLRPPRRGRAFRTVVSVLAGGVFEPELIGNGAAPLFRMYKLYQLWLKATSFLRHPFRKWTASSPAA